MFEKLDEVEGRYAELNSMLADPSITSDPEQLMKISKEHSQLKEVVDTYKAYQSAGEELEQSKEMLAESDDDEMRQLIREEITSLEAQREELSEKLQFLLIPKDPMKRTSSSRFAPPLAATKRRFSSAISSGCTRNTPTNADGA